MDDKTAKLKIIVIKKGRYQSKDSTLVNSKTKNWLHKYPRIDKNKTPDCGESPISYGYLEGAIIKGKREGKWVKKIKIQKLPYYSIVKKLNYTNGILNVKYMTSVGTLYIL